MTENIEPCVKPGDRVRFWVSTVAPQMGTVVKAEIKYQDTYAEIAPDSEPKVHVYLFSKGGVWRFERIESSGIVIDGEPVPAHYGLVVIPLQLIKILDSVDPEWGRNGTKWSARSRRVNYGNIILRVVEYVTLGYADSEKPLVPMTKKQKELIRRLVE